MGWTTPPLLPLPAPTPIQEEEGEEEEEEVSPATPLLLSTPLPKQAPVAFPLTTTSSSCKPYPQATAA